MSTMSLQSVQRTLAKIDRRWFQEEWLIALDRDGTIVPYAERPEEATVDPDLWKLLNLFASERNVHVAIVSARSVAQLSGDFDAHRIILAGNYGLEVSFPDQELQIEQEAQEALPLIKGARDLLASELSNELDSILEDHGYTLCLHWHTVEPERLNEVHRAVDSVAELYPQLYVKRLPTSYEFLPSQTWDKGLAVERIDAAIPRRSNKRLRFFAGDTSADEPAFQYVNEHGGISIKVGETTDTAAQIVLPDPPSLWIYLRELLMMRATTLI